MQVREKGMCLFLSVRAGLRDFSTGRTHLMPFSVVDVVSDRCTGLALVTKEWDALGSFYG
jgi:hypothetical protein